MYVVYSNLLYFCPFFCLLTIKIFPPPPTKKKQTIIIIRNGYKEYNCLTNNGRDDSILSLCMV